MILFAPDQATHPLLQRKRRLGQLVVAKRIAARRFEVRDARLHQRVLGRGERQLLDDDESQRFALHVDPLPEARRAEEHRIAQFAKLPQQLLARRAALHEQWPG